MSISTTDTILAGLKTELIATISGAGNYNNNLTSAQVERGIVSWQETDGRRPYVWFIMVEESFEESFSTSARGELTIELHGYTDRDGSNDNIHKLLRDIKYFLYNDYSQICEIDTVMVHEGGAHEQLNMSGFMIVFRVPYSYNTTTL